MAGDNRLLYIAYLLDGPFGLYPYERFGHIPDFGIEKYRFHNLSSQPASYS